MPALVENVAAAGFFADDAVLGGRRGQDGLSVGAVGDEDGLGHAVVERGDVVVPRGGVGVVATADAAGVVEDADDGGIAAREHAGDAAGAASVATGFRFVYKDLVALHGAVELEGWDEEIVVARGAAVGPDEAEAVAVKVEPAGEEAVAGDPAPLLPFLD